MKNPLRSRGNAGASRLLRPNPYPHCGPCWVVRRRGGALLQTLRTRIFLSLSDDASAKIASELCGQVAKIKGSYTISETSKRAGVSPLSGRAGGGGGSIGATKSFQERREAVFHPRDFALLGNCQAICLPYDGAQSLEPRRVYLKPHYLPLDHSYWRAKEAGQI